MGLLAQVQGAIDTAFTAAGDLVGELCLTREVIGAYDPAAGETANQSVDYFFEGIVDTSRKAGSFDTQSTGSVGSEVEGSEQRVYLKPANDVTPEVGDVLRVNETKYRVSQVLPVKPDGVTVLLWELVCTL